MVLKQKFYKQPTLKVAQNLLGCFLITNFDGLKTVGRIVETEAYTFDDEASHSFKGKTRKNSAMFNLYGHSYVYLIYGMYYCFNVVTGKKNQGEAVLIRALEPVKGVEIMRKRRNQKNIYQLCNGPSKLTMALGINKIHSNKSLIAGPIKILSKNSFNRYQKIQIKTTNRIGITKNTHLPYRFYITNNPFISKK